MADPGFPRGGANSKGRDIFSPKNFMKMKEIGPRRGASLAPPLDPPMPKKELNKESKEPRKKRKEIMNKCTKPPSVFFFIYMQFSAKIMLKNRLTPPPHCFNSELLGNLQVILEILPAEKPMCVRNLTPFCAAISLNFWNSSLASLSSLAASFFRDSPVNPCVPVQTKQSQSNNKKAFR